MSVATYQELLAQKEALEAHLEEVRANELAGVVTQIQELMQQYGLTVEDLASKRRRGRPAGSTRTAKAPLPAKYMDPKTGKTWSGRGRAPAWLGKRPEKFLVAAE